MSGHDTPAAAAEPVAHPLALRLSAALAGSAGRVLLLGVGSGRNVPALLAAGLRVAVVEADAERARAARERFAGEPRVSVTHAQYASPYATASDYVAALSTHALLHGTLPDIAAAVAAVRACLLPGAPFFATLGSTADPRFGSGSHLEGNTFAPLAGSEADVPHTYFDERGARELFAGFAVTHLVAESAAHSAGTWAHSAAEAATLVHWSVIAQRPRP